MGRVELPRLICWNIFLMLVHLPTSIFRFPSNRKMQIPKIHYVNLIISYLVYTRQNSNSSSITSRKCLPAHLCTSDLFLDDFSTRMCQIWQRSLIGYGVRACVVQAEMSGRKQCDQIGKFLWALTTNLVKIIGNFLD